MAAKWNANANPTKDIEHLMKAKDLDKQSESSESSDASFITVGSKNSETRAELNDDMAENWNADANRTENIELSMTAEDLDQQSENSQFTETSSLITTDSETSSAIDRMMEELKSFAPVEENLEGSDIESLSERRQRVVEEIEDLDIQIAQSEEECNRLRFLRCVLAVRRDKLRQASMQNM